MDRQLQSHTGTREEEIAFAIVTVIGVSMLGSYKLVSAYVVDSAVGVLATMVALWVPTLYLIARHVFRDDDAKAAAPPTQHTAAPRTSAADTRDSEPKAAQS